MRNLRLLRTKTNLGSADTRWWETQGTPPDLGRVGNAASKVLVVFQQVNGSTVVAHGTSPTTQADVTVIPYALDNSGAIAVQGGAEALTGHDLSQPVTCEVPPGWSFAVWLGAVSNPNGSATGVRVWYQDFRP